MAPPGGWPCQVPPRAGSIWKINVAHLGSKVMQKGSLPLAIAESGVGKGWPMSLQEKRKVEG
jgi:hypothetical protein